MDYFAGLDVSVKDTKAQPTMPDSIRRKEATRP